MSDRRFDVTVFGATSYVGQILCRRLVERAGTQSPLRWAIAGRDAAKLERVAAETGADVERIVADASDPAALRELANASRLVVSCVGPYARYGSPLVAAVVATGTDYCDLTGETQWVRRMIDEHQHGAVTSGARLVPSCGFDSIPSDLGVWFTQRAAIERFGEPCKRIGFRLVRAKGGASGGTIASMLNVAEEARRDPAVRAVLADPYALAPPEWRYGPRQPDVRAPQHDELSGQWVAPFVMATVNTRVVHRSHALLGRPWGEDFTYDEATLAGRGARGAAMSTAVTGGVAGMVLGAAFSPTRRLMSRFLPSPGEGPTPEARARGSFEIRFYGRTRAGERIVTRVTADQDPGYGATSNMLAEVALGFGDVERDDVGGGFWTPATMFGDPLIARLREHAGMTFDVVASP